MGWMCATTSALPLPPAPWFNMQYLFIPAAALRRKAFHSTFNQSICMLFEHVVQRKSSNVSHTSSEKERLEREKGKKRGKTDFHRSTISTTVSYSSASTELYTALLFYVVVSVLQWTVECSSLPFEIPLFWRQPFPIEFSKDSSSHSFWDFFSQL